MKAISLLQPWASLLASGIKQWETRSWPTTYRGRVAIHASKKFTAEERAIASERPFISAIRRMDDVNRSLPTGVILAVAAIVDCQPTRRFGRVGDLIKVSEEEFAFGNFGPDRYAFRFAYVLPLSNPIPCRGALGFWDVPAEVVEEIHEQLVEIPREVADA